ncbi:MAG TPA: hypothetical protein VN737_07145 [Bryobacteraceae bacterium]|nr:hypothetical protein [Bryobacteraceae bacterium]
MPFELVAEYLNVSVAIVLILRLITRKLFAGHRVFGALIAFDLASSLAVLAMPWDRFGLDYRFAWLAIISVSCILYVWVVYAMLRTVMINHPGILKMSRRVSIVCFVIAGLLALGSAHIELAALNLQADSTNLAFWVEVSFVVERALCTASLALLALMLFFLLWFPVQVSRNVAGLSAGLLVYFAAKTVLIFGRDVWSPDSLRLVSAIIILISTGCLLFWAIYLTPTREYAQVRIGHSWKPADQERLMQQLEALNSALLRSRQSTRIPTL